MWVHAGRKRRPDLLLSRIRPRRQARSSSTRCGKCSRDDVPENWTTLPRPSTVTISIPGTKTSTPRGARARTPRIAITLDGADGVGSVRLQPASRRRTFGTLVAGGCDRQQLCRLCNLDYGRRGASRPSPRGGRQIMRAPNSTERSNPAWTSASGPRPRRREHLHREQLSTSANGREAPPSGPGHGGAVAVAVSAPSPATRFITGRDRGRRYPEAPRQVCSQAPRDRDHAQGWGAITGRGAHQRRIVRTRRSAS